MDFTIVQMVLVAVIVLVGSVVQSAVGFGMGLLAIPLFLWVGLKPEQAVTVNAAAALLQCVSATHHLRKHIRWRDLAIPIIMIILTLPLGVWTLWGIAQLDKTTVKQIFGGILLIVLIVHWLLKIKPRDVVHWGWGVLVGTISGYVGGMSGMGGPPVVLWVMAHNWTSHESRVALLVSFLARLPLNLILLYLMFGHTVTSSILLGLFLLPVILVGNTLGLYVGNRTDKRVLRPITSALLWIIAVASLLDPLLSR